MCLLKTIVLETWLKVLLNKRIILNITRLPKLSARCVNRLTSWNTGKWIKNQLLIG